ncbi:unnamed protein product [Thelazia callipaeda]|uniref:Elongation of fatty acids protein n=1 Tax=Thelazia callipaeda TaxID=103827 RepID=A0A0N5D7G8_THECL|nr:unnamed protein product [Thelazia callipaeda]
MMNQQYEVLLTPLFIYMRVLGLTNYTDNPVLRYPLMIYNIVIIIIMNSYSLLIVSEIRFIGLDVDFAFATIHACYLASGGICSLFLFWMQRSFNRLSKIVIQQVGAYDPDFHQAARIHKMCKMMKLNNDEEKSLSNIILFLIHLYVAFLTQSALMSWSVFFVLPCNILAACVDAFAEDMHRDGIEKDDKWTNTEAVALVMHYKHRYRGLKKAADVIEEQFKFAIAYVDALCFTELCFILYTYLQDKSKDKTWIDMALCASYAVNSVFHMTLFTAPAYRLYERVR